MATYQPAKKNTAWIGYISLVSQASTLLMKSNPTLATGDFKVSIDGGALANLATLPTVTPASGVMVKVSLSSSEMNGDNITVVCSDAAGAEWCDLVFNIQTAARQIDDLAYPATSGRSMVVDANGLVDANTVKLGPTGSGTAQTAKDVGAAVPAAAAGASGGLLISGSNSGTTTLGALTVTGATTHTGNVVLSDGLTISAPSTTNRAGFSITGNGSGAALDLIGGAAIATTPAGPGLKATGGAASTGAGGVAGVAIAALGGAGAASTNGAATGVTMTGGGTNTVASAAHGLSVIGASTGSGQNAASGAGATGNGITATALSTNGSGLTLVKTGTGSDFNATVTPLTLAKTTNITGFNDIAATAVVSSGAITTSGGAVSTVTTLTNLPAITANWLTAAGTAADFGAEIATAIWTDTTASDFTTALSIGKTIVNGVSLGTGLTINAYTGNTVQTGDSYARLGAPAGASVSADIATRATPAQVKTQVVDGLATDTYAEPGQGAPAATTTLAAKVNYLYKWTRNKKDNDGTTTNFYADDATTVDQKQATSSAAGVVTKGEIATGP